VSEDGVPPDWKPLLDGFTERERAARAMGGEAKLARQHRGGRLDARQRIDTLLDAGSFRELGTFAGIRDSAPADALVAGAGRIAGRPVLIGSEDFSVMGGSIGPGSHAKRLRLAELAAQERVPLVMLLEGAGERVTNALKRHGYGPNDLQSLVRLSGLVPTVCAVMGASAGHGALSAPLMDFVVMVEGAALFAAGPPLVEAAIGEKVTKDDLGGVGVHVKESGVAHNAAADDAAALALVRRYLGYFPSNAWQHPPGAPEGTAPDGPRRLDGVLSLVPADARRPYDMRALVAMTADRDSVLEIQPRHGAAMLTCLARLAGRSVAIVANQPMVRAGAIDREAADKSTHFLQVVGAFHLPVVFLADNPGVMSGSAAERSGALRAGARLFHAQAKLPGAKLHVTVRKAFGFGSSIMAMNPFDGQTLTLAFPGAALGAMPSGGAGAVAGADAGLQQDLDASQIGGPWNIANSLGYDEVIDPRELRNALIGALETASGRLSEPPTPVTQRGVLP